MSRIIVCLRSRCSSVTRMIRGEDGGVGRGGGGGGWDNVNHMFTLFSNRENTS